MEELKNILNIMRNVTTSGDNTILMAECMIRLSKYINEVTTTTNAKEE